MMKWILRTMFRLRKDESGAALLYVTITLPTIIALTSLAIDLGYVWYVKTRLQVAADMGALAGAAKLYTDNSTAVNDLAKTYVNVNLPSDWTTGMTPSATSKPEVKCLETIKAMGLTCSSLSGGNALKVTVTATTPLFFANALGFKTITLSANSMVSGGGSSPPPLNVAIVLDATLSMNSLLGSSCGTLTNPKKIECASLAAKTLLTKLWASVDQVALYTYPAFDSSSKNVVACKPGNSGKLKMVSYKQADNPNYQMFAFTNSFGDTSSPPKNGLNTSSDLVLALGKSASSSKANDSTNCAGLATSGLGIGTSIADAIAQAQKDLLAANDALVAKGEPKRQNVLIVLSDGDANGNTNYTGNPSDTFVAGTNNSSWVIDVARQMDQCQAAVVVADAAATQGTWVYSIAFAADNTPKKSCFSDRPVTTATSTNSSPSTRNCTNGNKCKAIALATNVTSTIGAVSGSKQIATTTTTQTVTTCTKPDGSTSGTCTTTTTNKVQTDTYDLSKYDTTACDTMKGIASDDSKFYSTDGNAKCASAANPDFTDLVAIFNNVAASIMKKRRIPSSTT